MSESLREYGPSDDDLRAVGWLPPAQDEIGRGSMSYTLSVVKADGRREPLMRYYSEREAEAAAMIAVEGCGIGESILLDPHGAGWIPETPAARRVRLLKTLDAWESKEGRHASEQASYYRRQLANAGKHERYIDYEREQRGELVDAGWGPEAIRQREIIDRLGGRDGDPDSI